MWNLYNLIDKGDFLQGKITRKIAIEGTVGAERKTMSIVLKIQEIDYDQDSNVIRVKGKNVSENKFIQVGQFQSMEINSSSVVTLIKKRWDDVYEERLKMATDPASFSDLAVIVFYLYFIIKIANGRRN